MKTDKQKGWTTKGEKEVRQLLERIHQLVQGEEQGVNDTWWHIFKAKSHVTWECCFSGDIVMDYCSRNGYDMMCTVQHGCLPYKVGNKYLHKETTKPGDHRALVARF